MRRFIATYRWELWLLLWAPLLGSVATSAALSLSGFLYDIGLVTRHSYVWDAGVASLAEAGLLLAFYGRVRRSERRLLELVWGYSLAVAAVAVPVYFIGTALWFPVHDQVGSRIGLWLAAVSLAHLVLVLPVLLWFARRASRFSLAHAFFLFLIVKSYTLAGILGLVIVLVPVGLGMAMNTVAYFGQGFVFAWLLGNFDSRDALFRKRVLGWLLAVYAVSVLVGLVQFTPSVFGAEMLTLRSFAITELFFMQFLTGAVLPLALIYIVRVRQPALHGNDDTEPPEDLRVQ